jgi:ribosome-binding factor A
MATLRQNKVSRLLQKEIGDIFLKEKYGSEKGVMITITVVRVSPDLALAKTYMSVFPSEKSKEILADIKEKISAIRGLLGRRVKNQLRIVPELVFYIDDSLDYAEKINNLLK